MWHNQHSFSMKELEIMGKSIVRYRQMLNLTQEDLCGMAEIDRSYLLEMENGKMSLTINALKKIANSIGVEVIGLRRNN